MSAAGKFQTPNQRLGSWKEIAGFFDCDERTLRRWEKERGLPIHRTPGGAGGKVFAYTEELSAWLAASRNSAAMESRAPSVAVLPATAPRAPIQPRWKTARMVLAAMIGLGVVGLALLYRSPVPGGSGSRPGRSTVAPVRQDSSGLVLASSVPHSPEAEEFYLQGRYYWEKRTPDGLSKAVDYFTQAIVHDPNYAAAYVGLADTYNLLREYTLMPPSEAFPRALAAAKKAVELDDQSSEAHASLAFALFYGEWDIANAEHEFRRAVDLNPNNAVAHHWYATYLMTVRRFPESLAEIERAEELDPSSSSILADKGLILLVAGQRGEALALLKQMEVAEPAFRSPHLYLRNFYRGTGDYPDFLVESRKDALVVHDQTELTITAAAEKGFAAGGAREMFERMLPVEKKLYAEGMVPPFALADTYVLLGNEQETLRYLKVAFDEHDAALLGVENYPEFNGLRNNPAYRDLLARMNLPVEN